MPEVNPMYVVGLTDEHVRQARRLVFTVEVDLPTHTGPSSTARFQRIMHSLGDGARAAADLAGQVQKPVGMHVRVLDAQGRDLL